MKYVNFLVLMSLLLTLNLSAKTYEDGEDKKISRWETLAPSSSAIIKNVYDKSKKSQVIQFNGNGTKDAYIFMINESKNKKYFRWEMKYSEDFVIFISLDTKLGKRYLIYTPGSRNAYMQFGLGRDVKSGTWQKYSRNLEDDLQYFDNRNSIIKINSFVIRGSGAVDNIEIVQEKSSKAKTEIEKKHSKVEKRHSKSKKKHSKVKKKHHASKKKHTKVKKKYHVSKKKHTKIKKKYHESKKKHCKSKKKNLEMERKKLAKEKKRLEMIEKIKNDKAPTIIIKGENPYYLTRGETFVDPGVIAQDDEDGELVVTSSEDIDKHKEGKYVVIYMATDSNGNSAIDKREVIIGGEPNGTDNNSQEVRTPREVRVEHVAEEEPRATSSSREEDAEEQYRIEERELEISEWEKELQLREQELSQREKSMTE